MSCAKLKSAGPMLFFALFGRLCVCEETRFGSFPVSILPFLHVGQLLQLSVILRHKGAHLKRLNANLISYMKQSWFIFPALFFLSLQTPSQRTQRTPSMDTPPQLESCLSTSSQRNGKSSLWTVATLHQHLTPPPPPPAAFLQSISAHSRCRAPKIAAIL